MRSLLIIILTVFFAFSVTSRGSAMVLDNINHEMVISNAQGLKSTDEKVDYLLVTGEYMLYKKRFAEAREIARYILNELDKYSLEAYKILLVAKIIGPNP